MMSMFARNWWALAVRGVAAVILGILMFVWPGLSLMTLLYLFGAYVLIDGVFGLYKGLTARHQNESWWGIVLSGVLGIIIGLVTFLWPGVTGLILLYIIAIWAIIAGLLDIVAAIQLRQVIRNEWLMIISGLLSILFGVILIAYPGQGAMGMVMVIGLFSIGCGILRLIVAFRLRGLQKSMA